MFTFRALSVLSDNMRTKATILARTAGLAILLISVVLLTVHGAAAPDRDVSVVRGQSPAEVRAKLGTPIRSSRQLLFGRHLEQWVYEEPRPLRVEFSCFRGDEPYVCAILQLSPARP
jgi:hypothetical protein